MDKQKAIDTFGTASDLARIIGCTPSAIFQWPDILPERISDRVIGACWRKGIDPSPLLNNEGLQKKRPAA